MARPGVAHPNSVQLNLEVATSQKCYRLIKIDFVLSCLSYLLFYLQRLDSPFDGYFTFDM